MRHRVRLLIAFSGVIACCLAAGEQEAGAEHVIVYRVPGGFGGWPANHGIWSWGDEIVVGFNKSYLQKQDPDRHQVDRSKPGEPVFGRSLDGGITWRIESHPLFIPPSQGGTEPAECPGGIDFMHPDFAMTLRMSGVHTGPSRFYYSTDRCRTWKGPYKLPMFGRAGIAARTDYIVEGKHECLIFLTAAKENQREGRVMCARTTDGGKTWRFRAWIGPEPSGFYIMPSSVRLSPTRVLTTIRCSGSAEKNWIDAYLSDDRGETWNLLNRPVASTGGHHGSPPSLIQLRDGRLCLTYGYRSAAYGIRVKLSSDGGRSWGDEIILRRDGGCWDLGYPRSVQRADGKVVAIYYFNEHMDKERYIAATIWDPGKP